MIILLFTFILGSKGSFLFFPINFSATFASTVIPDGRIIGVIILVTLMGHSQSSLIFSTSWFVPTSLSNFLQVNCLHYLAKNIYRE